ncbi:purine nucleoside permease [Acetobacter musti]|uniref:Purine nucleoside permease n=1 Tax=Acetobacter musti TaxID=864732 RepID=A0ABX0JRJ1_9PROT|nr:purine nucleoside permease [Acetobacter musti]NHN85437.1 purine nucleoside permease [Acetobacter musti]
MPQPFPDNTPRSAPALRTGTIRRPAALIRLARAAALLGSLTVTAARAQTPAPWPVKVVILTTFENGNDTGDKPGELQLWAEREHLTEKIDFPGGVHPILATPDHSEIVVLTGMTLVNAGASVMALGTDPRFDLRQSYWLVAGIAGVDPAVASVGSAAWARYVVNDVAQSIDMREAPSDWPYGLYVNGTTRPDTLDGTGSSSSPGISPATDHGPMADYPIVFPLNAGLAQWAWQTTRDTALMNTPAMAQFSKGWSAYTGARHAPAVIMGDSFASDLYWHGTHLNHYARDWVRLFTAGHDVFAMSNMEDSAIAAAMTRLDHMHRADFRRLMVLRTASNYTLPPKGQTTLQSVTASYPDDGIPAYEAAWRVGSKVVHTLIAGWPRYATTIPAVATDP